MGRKKGSMSKATGDLILQAKEIIEESRPHQGVGITPMTLRQLYYQLVARCIIENKYSQYQKLSDAIVAARKKGIIPWHYIEDRLRRPRTVSMWNGPRQFGNSVISSYRQNIWPSQPIYLELWLEKDALSGIFEDILGKYGVTLNVGRGYDSWTSIKDAATRYNNIGKQVRIMYFGDFDPSGVDMDRSLEERLNFFKDCKRFDFDFEIERIAILEEDIQHYDLPPAMPKRGDKRTAKFVEEYGETAVELDALPVKVLNSRIRRCVEENLDMDHWAEVRMQEEVYRGKLMQMFAAA